MVLSFRRESWEAIVSSDLMKLFGDVRGAVCRQNIRSGPFISQADHWSNLGPTICVNRLNRMTLVNLCTFCCVALGKFVLAVLLVVEIFFVIRFGDQKLYSAACRVTFGFGSFINNMMKIIIQETKAFF